MRQALEKLHIKQDWSKLAAESWRATLGDQHHEITLEHAQQYEMVYRINGDDAKTRTEVWCLVNILAIQAQQDWVYAHTF